MHDGTLFVNTTSNIVARRNSGSAVRATPNVPGGFTGRPREIVINDGATSEAMTTRATNDA